MEGHSELDVIPESSPMELSSIPGSPSPSYTAGVIAEGGRHDVEWRNQKARGEEVAVTVAVRARPLLPRERAEGAKACLVADTVRKEVLVGSDRLFTLNHVLGPEASQDDVYSSLSIGSLVRGLLEGYNATIFAYGQTGSGKTHTMGIGAEQEWERESSEGSSRGVVPRVIDDLFDTVEHLRTAKPDTVVSVRCQFLEVHNEEVRDLLNPSDSGRDVVIREGPSGTVMAAGAIMGVARSREELWGYLRAGVVTRTTGSTNMNLHSSRSHAIFTLLVERTTGPGAGPDAQVVAGKMHLVDLAGSERQKKTGASGARLRESVAINQGLLALGSVISALSADPRKRRGARSFVPYRQSKLTRMLQDSLGGNSRTCMIACVSVADSSMDETLNTLKYAARARSIRNRVEVNRESISNAIAAIQSHAQQARLDMLRRHLQDPLNNPPPDTLYSALGPEMADLLVEHIRSSPSPSHLAAARSPSTPGTSPFGAAPSAPGVQGILAGDTAQAMEESLERLRRENAELRAQLERMERGATAASRAGGGGDREGARAGTGTLSEQMVPPLHVGESAAGTGGTGTGRAVVGEERPHTALGRLQALQGERWDRHGGPQRMTKSVVGPAGSESQSAAELQELVEIKDRQLRDTQMRLKEAVEDLERDEAIFAEKMKDMKALRKLTKRLAKENESLKQSHRELEERITKRQQDSRPARVGPLEDDSVLLASDTEGHEASRQGEVDRRFEQRALEEALQQRDREIQQLRQLLDNARQEVENVSSGADRDDRDGSRLLSSLRSLVREGAAAEVQAMEPRRSLDGRIREVQEEIAQCRREKEAVEERVERGRRRAEERVGELEGTVGDMEAELADMRERADAGDQVAAAEVAALTEAHQQSILARAEAQAALAQGSFVSESDEATRADLEDRLDALQTELAYLEGERDEAAAQEREAQSTRERLRSKAHSMGLGKRSMALFEALLEAEVRALQATKEGEAKALALEVAVAEAQQEARETRAALLAKEAESKRKMEALERKHAEQLQSTTLQLSQALQASSADHFSEDPLDGLGKLRVEDMRKLLVLYREQAEMLGKDNAFYKATNRELKRRLRREQEALDALRNEAESGALLSDSLRASNRALAAEVARARNELRASMRASRAAPGTPVRDVGAMGQGAGTPPRQASASRASQRAGSDALYGSTAKRIAWAQSDDGAPDEADPARAGSRRYNPNEFSDTVVDVTEAPSALAESSDGDGSRTRSDLQVDTSHVGVDTSIDEMDLVAAKLAGHGMGNTSRRQEGQRVRRGRADTAEDDSGPDRPPSRTPSLSPYLGMRGGTAGSRSGSASAASLAARSAANDPTFEFDVASRSRRLESCRTIKLQMAPSEASEASETPWRHLSSAGDARTRHSPQRPPLPRGRGHDPPGTPPRASPPRRGGGMVSPPRPSAIPDPRALPGASPPRSQAGSRLPRPPQGGWVGGDAGQEGGGTGMSSEVLMGSPVRPKNTAGATARGTPPRRYGGAARSGHREEDRMDAEAGPQSPFKAQQVDRLKRLAESRRRVASARAHLGGPVVAGPASPQSRRGYDGSGGGSDTGNMPLGIEGRAVASRSHPMRPFTAR